MQIRKLIACVLTAAMVLSLFTVASATGTTANNNPAPKSYGAAIFDNTSYSNIKLGKTATCDNNWVNDKKTTINLTVESAAVSTYPPVLIEFVIDSTQSLDIYLAYNEIYKDTGIFRTPIGDLQTVLNGKNVYFGTTIFTSTATSADGDNCYSMDTVPNTYYDDVVNSSIEHAGKSKVGTNMQAGVITGLKNMKHREELLFHEKHIKPVARYLVLIADGGSFYYYENPDYPNLSFDASTLMGDWNEASEPGVRDNVNSLGQLRNGAASPNTNFEKAILASSYALDRVSEDKGVDMITIGFPYYKFEPNLSKLTSLANDAIQYAAGKSVYSHIFTEEKFNVSDTIPTTESVFKSITNDLSNSLLCAVPAGSTITDVIGYNSSDPNEKYDFTVDVGSDFTLSFPDSDNSQSTIKMTKKLQNNQIIFTDSKGIEYAVLQYHPKTAENEENFVLTLKRPLPNGKKLTLSYTASISNTVQDGNIHVVDTNKFAYLVPQTGSINASSLGVSDSIPVDKGALTFPMPSLEYKGEKGIIPSSGGGKTPMLNTEDHFGYIIGYPEDYVTGEWTNEQPRMPVYPNRLITRAEVATIYFRMLTDASREELWTKDNPFSDVSKDAWYAAAVSTLTNGGILSGYPGGKFRPNDPISRAEFATIAVRFFGGDYNGPDLFSDIGGHWAQESVNLAATKGLINGYPDGTFRPDQKILRCEAITIVNRSLDRHPVKEHFLPDMLKWPDNMDTSKWYYAEMQEATNSHEYDMKSSGDGKYEIWTKMLPMRDWVQFERTWSDAHSASNPGEVVNVNKCIFQTERSTCTGK